MKYLSMSGVLVLYDCVNLGAAIADAFVLHQDRPSTRCCFMDPLDISDLLVAAVAPAIQELGDRQRVIAWLLSKNRGQ
jgi:hypothetical protein